MVFRTFVKFLCEVHDMPIYRAVTSVNNNFAILGNSCMCVFFAKFANQELISVFVGILLDT
jgi:hypothetical protein